MSSACVDQPDAPAPRASAAARAAANLPAPSSRPSPDVSSAPSASAPSAVPAEGTKPTEGPWPEQVLTWDYTQSPIGRTRVVVVSPKTDERLPVLIALHGLGEAQKGPAKGARGWIDDYGLMTALERLAAPPLTKQDMQELGTPAHLARVNDALGKQPYRGLVVVCPYTPDILGVERSLDAADSLGEFLVKAVLPRVYAETPAIGTAATTGIDGVSLGGRAALLVGLRHPERFGVIGSMQAAVYGKDLDELTRRAKAARAKEPKLTLRVLTSSHDFYKPVLSRWSKQLEAERIEHGFELIERGPHSYAFNRGLGVYALLMFHDQALR